MRNWGMSLDSTSSPPLLQLTRNAYERRKKHVQKSLRSIGRITKKKKKKQKARKEDAAIEQEGTTYEAGAFDPNGTLLRVSGGTAQPNAKSNASAGNVVMP